MNKFTVISHFYNEEYLLPHWLNHHKKIFDHGILIDYDSTDNSVSIIKEICPTWTIVKSKNEYFESRAIDREVMEYEVHIDGFKICLNTTEFVLGNFSSLRDVKDITKIKIPQFCMVDPDYMEGKAIEKDLIKERTFGTHYNVYDPRLCRLLHNDVHGRYDTDASAPHGRHFPNPNTNDFIILWYGFSPWTDELIKRRLQIATRIPDSDKPVAVTHFYNKNELYSWFKDWQRSTTDLSGEINKFLSLTFNEK